MSSSIFGIAKEAAQTREEIDTINAGLVASEGRLRCSFVAHGQNGDARIALLRLPVDTAAWKRKLAGALVGLEAGQDGSDLFDGRPLRRALEGMQSSGDGQSATIIALLATEARAFEQARAVVAALAKHDDTTATGAYMDCDRELADLCATADRLWHELDR